jgi:hypothetical protein
MRDKNSCSYLDAFIPRDYPNIVRRWLLSYLLDCEVKESLEFEGEIDSFYGFDFLAKIKKD